MEIIRGPDDLLMELIVVGVGPSKSFILYSLSGLEAKEYEFSPKTATFTSLILH